MAQSSNKLPMLNSTSVSADPNAKNRPNLLPPYTPQNPFRLNVVENPWSPRSWRSVKSVTTVISGSEATDDILLECVNLFSNNFGVWSKVAERFNKRARAGTPVRINVEGLRMQCVTSGTACTLARHRVEDELVGYAFATRWTDSKLKGNVCWITQIVVHKNFRGLGIATQLLSKLKTDTDVLFGIISSHPAALMALSRAASDTSIASVNLFFIRKHISRVFRESSLNYLRFSELYGCLFVNPNTGEAKDSGEGEDEDDGTISCVKTDFFMEHDEALRALDYLRTHKKVRWPLGDLLEGVEFVLLVKNKDHAMAKGRLAA